MQSSQPSSLGRRAASSPGMHQECRISQCPPSQTGAGRAAASGSGRCRTSASALQALPLCTAGADLDPLASFWAGGAESRCQVIPPSRAIRARRVERSHQPCRAEEKTYSTVCCSGAGRASSSRERERFTSVTLGVAVSPERLSVPWQPLEPRRQPRSGLRSGVRAQSAAAARPAATRRHLPTGHPANREPVRAAGAWRDGSCGPGAGASPAAAGARRHAAAGRA